jgi:hypothetical protein
MCHNMCNTITFNLPKFQSQPQSIGIGHSTGRCDGSPRKQQVGPRWSANVALLSQSAPVMLGDDAHAAAVYLPILARGVGLCCSQHTLVGRKALGSNPSHPLLEVFTRHVYRRPALYIFKKGLVTRHRFQVGVREPLSQSGPLLSDTPFGAYVALRPPPHALYIRPRQISIQCGARFARAQNRTCDLVDGNSTPYHYTCIVHVTCEQLSGCRSYALQPFKLHACSLVIGCTGSGVEPPMSDSQC